MSCPPCLLTGAWISVFKYLVQNWKRNDAFNYVLTLVHSLAFEVLNLQNGVVTVWITHAVISRGSACTFFWGRGGGQKNCLSTGALSSVLYCSVLFFNLNNLFIHQKSDSTVHEITMKLSSAGIKFLVLKKTNYRMWSVMLQESLRGGDHVYLCTGVWTPAFSALIKWVSPGIQDFLHVKVLYEDKVFLSFHKNIKYKLCWEEQGFTSPLWHSPFIPYSHHVILLQSPKMYKSALNLDLAFFDFSSLSFGTKPVC